MRRRLWMIGRGSAGRGGHRGIDPRCSVVARNDAQRSHQAFVTSSMDIASTLKLAIQQENSLVISAASVRCGEPQRLERRVSELG